LRHKVKKLFQGGFVDVDATNHAGVAWNDLSNALSSLNYSQKEVSSVIKKIAEEKDVSSLPFEQLMRKALSYLSKR